MDIKRDLDLTKLLKKKSFFLFGPRATGKSTLIRQSGLQPALSIDLLDSEYYLRLQSRPNSLESFHPKGVLSATDLVVIDEVQKVPALLDEVHRLLELRKCRFLLTGSSARKLKRGQANLLAGRAWTAELFPLTFHEIPNFDLGRYLRFGGLPGVYLSGDPQEELKAYTNTYLKEEILSEGLVRKLPQFVRFLKVASLSNSQQIIFSKVGSDAEVSASTVRDYFSILSDTMLGFTLEPWRESKKRKSVAAAKFYFFDTGVYHALLGTTTLNPNTDVWGTSFEHFIAMELKAYLSYQRLDYPMHYWRTESQFEVDFLVGEECAIEVKATEKVTDKHLKGLRALREENVFKKYYIISQDPIAQTVDGIRCLPWKQFLCELWGGGVITA